MPDPLAHLLDEIDAAAAGMQNAGEIGRFERRGHLVVGQVKFIAEGMTEQHAAYFAKFDPQFVQALVAVVKAVGEWDDYGATLYMVEHREKLIERELVLARRAFLRTAADLSSAYGDLRAIAAERAGAGE